MHPTEENSVFFCHFTTAEEGLIKVHRREKVRAPASSCYRTLQKEGSFMSERGVIFIFSSRRGREARRGVAFCILHRYCYSFVLVNGRSEAHGFFSVFRSTFPCPCTQDGRSKAAFFLYFHADFLLGSFAESDFSSKQTKEVLDFYTTKILCLIYLKIHGRYDKL